ncbi:hypothetical protein GCM10022251_73840 [Phytohabitans flavus]
MITGGTDGLGRGLADTYLRRGHAVAIIGRDERKAASLPGAHFIAADLSLIDENRRVIEEINATFSTVDALVLCARYFRSTRFETAEGIEGTFALDYLSRFLLSYGLTNPQLIVNVSGAGLPLDLIHWDDLMLAHAYDGVSAQLQAGKANDLLGVNYAAQPGTGRARYVLLDPGAVSTSFAGEYDASTEAHVALLKRHGRPVREGIEPIVAVIDHPPTEPLSAFRRDQPIGLYHPFFDRAAADRLHVLTLEVVR